MINCLIIEDGRAQRAWKFLAVPHIGENIGLPDEVHSFEVTKVVHFPDHGEPSEHVQLHVKRLR